MNLRQKSQVILACPHPPTSPPSIDLDKGATDANYKYVLSLYLIVIVKAEELHLKLPQLLLYSIR